MSHNDILRQFATLNKVQAKRQLQKYADSYENYELGESADVITDELFDALQEIYEEKFGPYEDVGSSPHGDKVELPYKLYSLGKIKSKDADKEIPDWVAKYPSKTDGYVVADKIDGVSALYTVRHTKSGVVRHLYTRGNAVTGRDISRLITYLDLPIPKFDIAVRGEIVLPDEVFEEVRAKLIKSGTKNKLTSTRPVTAGIVNSSAKADSESFDPEIAKKLWFVSYRIVDWEYKLLNQADQYLMLAKMKFRTAWARLTKEISRETLEKVLLVRRGEVLGKTTPKAPYLIDGLVIAQNIPVEHPDDRNPYHMFAFKLDSFREVTVTGVIWQESKDGLLKPVVIYERTHLSGADCTRAGGDNARFIITNKIGPGARVVVTRSNEVIPRIVSVISPAESMDLPDYPEDAYGWNSTRVEFILHDPEMSYKVRAKRIEYFFKHMKIEHIGPANSEKLVNYGLDTISDIITASEEELADAVGRGIASKVYADLQSKISNCELSTLMTSSGIFGSGFGDRKIRAIVKGIPDIMDMANDPAEDIAAVIRTLKGFKEMAIRFAVRLPVFAEWLADHPMITIIAQPPPSTHKSGSVDPEIEQILSGEVIVFSGFRDDVILGPQIEALGGRIASDVSGMTTILIKLDTSKVTGKDKKMKGGITISLADFCDQYGLTSAKLRK